MIMITNAPRVWTWETGVDGDEWIDEPEADWTETGLHVYT